MKVLGSTLRALRGPVVGTYADVELDVDKIAGHRTGHAALHRRQTMSETVLVLRTCDAQMRSSNGFVWPKSGPVEAPDWRDDTFCGGGLHGLLWGDGDGTLVSWEPDAQWLVVEVLAVDVRALGRQIKFRRGVVVHCGTCETATRYVAEHGGAGLAIVGGTATAGHFGTATAGHFGTATAGDNGTAKAGDNGTAMAGFNGTAMAGKGGMICVRWWDKRGRRYRIAVGYVGENGIAAGVAYRCDAAGRLVSEKESTTGAPQGPVVGT